MNELPNLPGYLFEPTLGGVLSTVLTFILPLLAGLLVKQSWSAGVKGTVLLALSAAKVLIESVLASINAGADVNLMVLFYGTFLNFLVAVAFHFGILRGTGIQQAAMNSGNTDNETGNRLI